VSPERAAEVRALLEATRDVIETAIRAAADGRLDVGEGFELGLDLVTFGSAVVALCPPDLVGASRASRRAHRLAVLRRSRRAFVEPG